MIHIGYFQINETIICILVFVALPISAARLAASKSENFDMPD
jgi:hypothetical protein